MAEPAHSPGAKRVIFLGSQMAVGGAQRILLLQASWFQRQGYSVAVAFLYDKENLLPVWCAEYDVPIYNMGFAPPTENVFVQAAHFVGGIARLNRLLRAGRCDAILTFAHHASLIGLPMAWLAGIRSRVASHRGKIEGISPVLEWLHAQVINAGFAKCLVVVAERVKDDAVAEGVRADRIVKIANGVVLPSIDPKDRERARAKLGIAPGAPVLLTVGRLRYQKAHAVLLNALPSVLKRFPDAQMLIAGDGVLRDELQAQTNSLGISEHVRLLGVRHDIPLLMEASDAFVFPSRFEGMPNAVLEAMSHELPVIATAVQGVDEIIRDGENGILVPLEDPNELSGAIIDLLADPSRRRRLGAAARETIQEGYTVEIMCRQYEQLLLGERARES